MSTRRGFTLLEVIFALAIMAVGLVILGNIVTRSIGQAGESRDERIGAILADQKLGELLGKQSLDTEAHSGTFEGYPGYEWSFTHTNRSLEVTKPSDNQKEAQGEFAEVVLQVRIPNREKPIEIVAHKPIEPQQQSGQGQGQGQGK